MTARHSGTARHRARFTTTQRTLAAAGILTLATGLALTGAGAASAASDAGGYDAYTYTGTWGTNNTDEKWSNETGATATAKVTIGTGGGSISIWGNTDVASGKAAVQIDSATPGVVDTFNAAAAPGVDANWFTSPKLAEGEHTLKITVTGEKRTAATGAYVSVEGVNTTNGTIVWPTTAPPAPPAASPASTDLAKFTSSGTWDKTGGNTKWYSNATGAYVTVPVTIAAGGGTVTIKGTNADNYGFADFSVDGGAATSVDLYAVTRVESTPIWTSPTLSAGQHTIKVAVKGTKRTAATDKYVAVAGATTTNGTFGTATPPPATNPLADPVVKEKALMITSTAENSTTDWTTAYRYIEDIGDGRGYTGGIVGFTSAPGDMQVLLQHYSDIAPGNSLEKFLDEFAAIMAVPYDQRNAKSHELLDPQNFVAAWQSAADNDPKFKQAQRDERDRTYWTPAYDQAVKDGVGPLGLAELYDISVNHGPGTDAESFGGIVAAAAATSPPPSKGGNESAYLKALNDKRRAVLASWGDDQPNGRDEAFLELINSGNLQLTPPVSWHMYGEAFSISSNPTPR